MSYTHFAATTRPRPAKPSGTTQRRNPRTKVLLPPPTCELEFFIALFENLQNSYSSKAMQQAKDRVIKYFQKHGLRPVIEYASTDDDLTLLLEEVHTIRSALCQPIGPDELLTLRNRAKALIHSTKAAIQYVQTISHSTFLLSQSTKPRLLVILKDLIKQVQISLNTASITPQLWALLTLMGMFSLRAPGGRQNTRQLQQIKTNEAANVQALKEWSTKINAQGGMK